MSRRYFEITLHVPIGERRGKLWLERNDNLIQGILEVMGHRNVFTGSVGTDGMVEVKGNLLTLMRTLSYTALGCLDAETLRLDLNIQGSRLKYYIEGNEVDDEKML